VVSLSLEQADEILSTRVVLEAEAVRLAIRSMTPANHRYLQDLASRIQEGARDPDATSELDLAFHEKIWELSGNNTLRKILLQITAPLFAMGSIMRHGRRGADDGKRAQFRRSSHAAIIQHLKSGDAEKTMEAMREHISENWNQIRKHLEEYLASEGVHKSAGVE
jgi:DNA-binding GntR family transcriptional regulator